MLPFLSACLLFAEPANEWTQFGGANGRFAVAASQADSLPPWKRTIGPGRSGVVTDGKFLFVTSCKPKLDGKSGEEIVACLDLKTGQTKWEESVAVTMLTKQEYFGGDPIQPQATPCVFQGVVYTIGFTGLLHARDATTGRLIWQKDLIADCGAVPVQFGFAASPVVIDGRLIVHTGGRFANVAFEPKTGVTVWTSETAKPSYATPVVMNWKGRRMIVQLTQNAVFGLECETGKTVWSFDLPKKGLTNVPTPIPLDAAGQMVIAGQGCDGVRLIELSEADGVKASEKWHQKKVQFFYSTWTTDGKAIYGFSGNVGKRFAALNISDGSIIAQEIGQTDANALLLGDSLLLSRGDGVLTRCKLSKDGFEEIRSGKPLSGRCWAPPMVFGNSVILRSDTEIASIPLSTLTADFKIPADSGRTAMDDAFSTKK